MSEDENNKRVISLHMRETIRKLHKEPVSNIVTLSKKKVVISLLVATYNYY